MDAVTYPNDAVASAIEQGFAPFKISMLERHPDFKEACAGGRVLWGPTLIVADSRNHGKFAEALAGFDAIVERDAGTEIYPEAIYWQGVAGFMAGPKDWTALRRSWARLAKEYPGSRFSTHASVIEDT